jgi:hypothetical protein
MISASKLSRCINPDPPLDNALSRRTRYLSPWPQLSPIIPHLGQSVSNTQRKRQGYKGPSLPCPQSCLLGLESRSRRSPSKVPSWTPLASAVSHLVIVQPSSSCCKHNSRLVSLLSSCCKHNSRLVSLLSGGQLAHYVPRWYSVKAAIIQCQWFLGMSTNPLSCLVR